MIWVLAAVLLLTLLTFSGAMAAEGDPLKVSMELSSNTFTEPKTITVSITVSNAGEGDMPGPVTLYYPNEKQVEEFGSPTLGVGMSKTWTDTWKVTQAQLEAGKIAFKIKYPVYDDEGVLHNKTKIFSKKIIYNGAVTQVDVNRTITPSVAQKGQDVTVTYEILNTGNVDVSNITIKENSSISSTSAKIESIPAGEKATHTFKTTMGSKDLTSVGTITYKAGGKTYTVKKDEAVIKFGKVNLSASVAADKKGGAPGESINLTIKLKNSGTVDFNNVNVNDPVLGEIMTNGSIPAGETVTVEKKLVITESQDIQLSVSAQDATGEPVETASSVLKVVATDPTKQIALSVFAEPDRREVYDIPGVVRFTVTVSNDSAVDVENVSVKCVDKVLNTFDRIPAGETRSFTREMMISMAGTFQFTASCKDQLGQSMSFPGNLVLIEHGAPTPEPTEAPIVTPPAPVYATDPVDDGLGLDKIQNLAKDAKWILAGITAFLVALIAIGTVRRLIALKQSAGAVDHMERGNYRDYSNAPKGKRNEVRDNAGLDQQFTPTEENEGTEQDSELMAETLRKLYSKDKKEETPVEVKEVVPEETETAEPAAEEAPKAEEAKPAEPVEKPEVKTQNASDFAKKRKKK